MTTNQEDAIAKALRGSERALRRMGLTLTKSEARRVSRWLWLAHWLRVRSGARRAQRVILAACEREAQG